MNTHTFSLTHTYTQAHTQTHTHTNTQLLPLLTCFTPGLKSLNLKGIAVKMITVDESSNDDVADGWWRRCRSCV